jgi:hypothetical protein
LQLRAERNLRLAMQAQRDEARDLFLQRHAGRAKAA